MHFLPCHRLLFYIMKAVVILKQERGKNPIFREVIKEHTKGDNLLIVIPTTEFKKHMFYRFELTTIPVNIDSIITNNFVL